MSFGPDNARHDIDALTVEAGAWFARMHSDQVTSEDEAAFSEWLDQLPAHRAAYDEAAVVWAGAGALRGHPALRPLMQNLRSDPGDAARARRDRRRFLVASAAGVAAAGAGATWFSLMRAKTTYGTAFGEQRRVALEDGSTLTLNTETRVRAEFTDVERRLWLDRGQVHFIVASDAARPFRVFVGEEEVRALGTRFEVRRDRDRMRVTLEEGSVAIIRVNEREIVRASETPRAELVLEPGQQAILAPASEITVAAVDTRRVTAWRFGQMILDGDPLSSAVAEINRYNTRQIVLESPALREMPISGLFQTGSPDAFVDAISAALPVEIASQDERTIRLVYAPPQ